MLIASASCASGQMPLGAPHPRFGYSKFCTVHQSRTAFYSLHTTRCGATYGSRIGERDGGAREAQSATRRRLRALC